MTLVTDSCDMCSEDLRVFHFNFCKCGRLFVFRILRRTPVSSLSIKLEGVLFRVDGRRPPPVDRAKMISEISCLSCNDLQVLRMPTVLCYVLCLVFVGGFDSHTLPPIFNDLQTTESLGNQFTGTSVCASG